MDQQPRDAIGRFGEKRNTGPEVSLTSEVDFSPLYEALDARSLALDEIPMDHEGKSIEDRYRELVAAAALPELPTLEEDIDDQLGHPNYGRHRGGPYPVWWNPEIDPNDDGQGLHLNALTREEAEAQGLILLADVHTRNGAGNRECYDCPDYGDGPSGHDEGCLAGVIEKLQEHPAYFGDWDNDFDGTYADFYFRIDPERTLAALAADKEAQRRQRARRDLDALGKGDMDPLALFPTNPEVVAASAKLLDEHTALRGELRTASEKAKRLPGSAAVSGAVTAAHGEDVDNAIAYLEGRADKMPKFKGSWYSSYRYEASSRQLRDDLVKARQSAQRAAGVRAALNGDLDPHVRAVLEEAMDSVFMDLKGAQQKESKAAEAVQKQLETLRGARDLLATPLAIIERMRENETQRKRLDAAAHWPGSPETAPVYVETKSDDPFSW